MCLLPGPVKGRSLHVDERTSEAGDADARAECTKGGRGGAGSRTGANLPGERSTQGDTQLARQPNNAQAEGSRRTLKERVIRPRVSSRILPMRPSSVGR